ncbi:MAG: hypothetical protein WA629_01770 [Candidatus Aquilonibacter sp.]
MKISAKFAHVALLAAVATAAATVGALANANLRIAGGVFGVEPGIAATMLCLDKNKDIANGVTPKTHIQPTGSGGRVGNAIVVSCP